MASPRPVRRIAAAPARARLKERYEDAATIYGIPNWGKGFFHVSEEGELVVRPTREAARGVALEADRRRRRRRGLRRPCSSASRRSSPPRVESAERAFATAIAREQVPGRRYRGVFPIKVNQLREVVEEILEAGRPFHYGIEVGSQARDVRRRSRVHTDNESLIICNGYKDDDYIRTALIGRKLGKKVILIAEKLSEVARSLAVAKEMGVEPMIGMRAASSTKGAGQVGGVGRRAREVRPLHRGDPRGGDRS